MSAYSSQIVMAFIVSFLAGLFTILGALVLFIKPIRKNNIVFVVYGNLFAAGAMIFVSLCEILQVKSVGAMLAHFCPDYSEECHSKHYGKTLGICYSLFFAGCVFCFAVNSLAHALLNRSENLFLRYDPDRNPETDEDIEKQFFVHFQKERNEVVLSDGTVHLRRPSSAQHSRGTGHFCNHLQRYRRRDNSGDSHRRA
ncbi:hypothetical protein MHBO_000567 [Bonamia ostreae]|uniref:Uncharacterized protein n=1 Tax=Bonamia ostreae TaxID=126728 RepID=A0ABV2AGM4_9EUKA